MCADGGAVGLEKAEIILESNWISKKNLLKSKNKVKEFLKNSKIWLF